VSQKWHAKDEPKQPAAGTSAAQVKPRPIADVVGERVGKVLTDAGIADGQVTLFEHGLTIKGTATSKALADTACKASADSLEGITPDIAVVDVSRPLRYKCEFNVQPDAIPFATAFAAAANEALNRMGLQFARVEVEALEVRVTGTAPNTGKSTQACQTVRSTLTTYLQQQDTRGPLRNATILCSVRVAVEKTKPAPKKTEQELRCKEWKEQLQNELSAEDVAYPIDITARFQESERANLLKGDARASIAEFRAFDECDRRWIGSQPEVLEVREVSCKNGGCSARVRAICHTTTNELGGPEVELLEEKVARRC
jgi:hypothetical protein